MRIFDSTVDGLLTFGEHSGLSLSRTGDLYAHLTHIGEIAIQINSKGQLEIATDAQYRMVLEQIEGTPQWQKKVSLSDPGVSRDESMTSSSFPVPLDRLFIAITSARRLTVEIKQLNNGQYSFHFPVTTMYKEDVKVRLLKSGLVNNGHINYISDLHTSAKHPTQVLNKDGWDLLDTIHEANNQTSNKSDLIILSGHFSDIYLTERDFIKKIMRHVMPLSENGASVIITNSFSHYKETAFNTLGFSTFKKSRASNDKAKGDYLLALNEHAMRAALVETP